jgi:hypothetical protein
LTAANHGFCGPGFAGMLDRLAGNGVRAILADRVARDLAAQLAGHDYLKALGITLIPTSVPDSFLEDTPTAVLVRQVLGAIAQLEKASLVAKLKAARDASARPLGDVRVTSRSPRPGPTWPRWSVNCGIQVVSGYLGRTCRLRACDAQRKTVCGIANSADARSLIWPGIIDLGSRVVACPQKGAMETQSIPCRGRFASPAAVGALSGTGHLKIQNRPLGPSTEGDPAGGVGLSVRRQKPTQRH